MTIRNLGQLDRYLSRSLGWRKKELTALKFAVDTAPLVEQKVLLRAATTLLYSHWEGFIKEAGTIYLELIARQGLNRGDLRPSFIAVTVGSQIVDCGKSHKVSVHKLLVETMTTGLTTTAKMRWHGIVKTRANLKTDVLREIIHTLDLDYAPFELKGKPVIDRLVKARNGIAHGAGLPVAVGDYNFLHTEIIALLQEFKTQIETAAATMKYKK